MTVRNAETMGAAGSEWSHAGYHGCGSVAGLLDSLRGRPALIAGNSQGVFADLHAAQEKIHDPVIFGVNDVGMYLPRMDHWVSLHADRLGIWKAVRWLDARAQDTMMYHSTDPRPAVTQVWDRLTPLFCLSGFFAMQVAYLMGCEPIVLCGCPAAPMPRFFEHDARKDFGYGTGPSDADGGVRDQLLAEMRRLPEFKARVRSMSGWTSWLFGGL